jgi:hypothetical protein
MGARSPPRVEISANHGLKRSLEWQDIPIQNSSSLGATWNGLLHINLVSLTLLLLLHISLNKDGI